MDGPRDHHIKESQYERERQIPYDISYRQNLNTQINISMKQKQTQTEKGLAVAIRERRQGKEGLGVWDQQMQTIIQRIEYTKAY